MHANRLRPALLLPALIVGGALALTSCTASDEAVSAPPSPVSTSPGADRVTGELYGPDAISLSEFRTRHPGTVTGDAATGAVLVEDRGNGPKAASLPPLDAGDRLVLALFCDSASPYEIALLSGETVLDKTWAADCATGGITTYTTAPLAAAVAAPTVSIRVDADTSFGFSILAATD